jgi:excisionase family DNA binding protein
MTEPEPSVEWLYTVDEVAERFGVSTYTIRRWVLVGEIQAYRVPVEKRDSNPNFNPKDLRTKWKPAKDSRAMLFFTWASIMDKAKVFYKLQEKKK